MIKIRDISNGIIKSVMIMKFLLCIIDFRLLSKKIKIKLIIKIIINKKSFDKILGNWFGRI